MSLMQLVVTALLLTPCTGLRLAGDQDRPWAAQFRPPFGTQCPDAKWVDAMVEADPEPGKVIVSIGCNKGQDAVRWMELWDMSAEKHWSTKNWLEHYAKQGVTNYACHVELPKVLARQAHLVDVHRTVQRPIENPTGVCVEAMHQNVENLRNAAVALGYNGTTSFGTFHIVEAAAGDSAGTVDFPDGDDGKESLHPEYARRRNVRPVTMKTVDAMVSELGLKSVDILSVDTEGADPAVLKGSTETLKSVRYLEFEVHRDIENSPWAKTSLHSVVTDLHDKDFDCYWAGNNGKLLNMNRCWKDEFEAQHLKHKGVWGNVACVKSSDPWSTTLRSFDTCDANKA